MYLCGVSGSLVRLHVSQEVVESPGQPKAKAHQQF